MLSTLDRPLSMLAPPAAYTAFYVAFLLGAAGASVAIGLRCYRTRSWLPVLALIGGFGVGVVVPPIYNTLTLVWFPSNIPGTFVTAFGMRDPFFDAIGYALFIGFGGWVLCEQLLAGAGRRAIVSTYLFWGVADLVIELPFLRWGLYTYYGYQPLTISGFPLHWVVMNGLIPVVSGYAMYLVARHWPGGRAGAAGRVVLCPAFAAGVLLVPMAPIATALNAAVPDLVRVVASLASIAISLSLLRWITAHLPTLTPETPSADMPDTLPDNMLDNPPASSAGSTESTGTAVAGQATSTERTYP